MSTWYKTGTVAVTNGSATVTGTGTAWSANVKVGEAFRLSGGQRLYEITAVVSDTELTISPAYMDTTQTGQAYEIVPIKGFLKAAYDALQSALSTINGYISGPLSGLFGNGTAGEPSIGFESDPNTGFFRAAADQIGAATNGIRRWLLTSSAFQVDVPITGTAVVQSDTDTTAGRIPTVGWMGLGGSAIDLSASDDLDTITASGFYYNPTASNTTGNNYPVSSAGSLLVIYDHADRAVQYFTAYASGYTYVRSNSNSSWSAWKQLALHGDDADFADLTVSGTLTVSDQARILTSGNDAFFDSADPAGTMFLRTRNAADTAMVNALQIDNAQNIYAPNGDVGLGDAPAGGARLEVSRLGSGTYPMPTLPPLSTIVTHPGNNSTSSGSAVTVLSGNTGNSGLYFGDADNSAVGSLLYYHVSDVLGFTVNGTEAMRINSSGSLLVGVTSGTAKVQATQSGDSPVFLGEAEHATYTKDVVSLNAGRAASSDYTYLKAFSGDFADLEFKLSGDGNGTCDGSWTGGGADYAEFFEWLDGNPDNEDRRGVAVVLDGAKIRPAGAGETPFGVISGNPSVVGDGDIDRWKGKYLRDEYGTYIWEDYEVVEWTETVTETTTEQVQATEEVERKRDVIEVVDGVAVKSTVTETVSKPIFDEYPLVNENGTPVTEQVQIGEDENGSPVFEDRQIIHSVPHMVEAQHETTKEVQHSYAADAVPEGITVPADATRTIQQRRKLNPDYDPDMSYTPRAERPEWDVVGLMGKLRLRKGQPVAPNWIKMRDVSADVEEWLVR